MFRWPHSLAVLTCFGLAACDKPQETPPVDAQRVAPSPAPVRLPVAEPPLDRRDMILAGLAAASAFASGGSDAQAQRALDGKRFEWRSRFGCGGPDDARDAGHGQGAWSVVHDEDTLRLRVEPDLSLADEVAARIAGEGFEAAEGFWIADPWLLDASCPAAPRPPVEVRAADVAPVAGEPAAAWLGIAQFFTATDARTHRRDSRAYLARTPRPEDGATVSAGYDLVLSGRLSRLPAGKVIACTGGGHDRPPTCIIAAQFDRVAIVDVASGATIADWVSR